MDGVIFLIDWGWRFIAFHRSLLSLMMKFDFDFDRFTRSHLNSIIFVHCVSCLDCVMGREIHFSSELIQIM